MSSLERAALVAQIEQRLEGGQNWDRLFARIVDEDCNPALRELLLTDRAMWDELERLTFERIARELEPA